MMLDEITPGDGNCFPHAISTIVNFLQLNKNDNVMLVAESILLVDSNWKLITGFSFLNENILQGQMFFV